MGIVRKMGSWLSKTEKNKMKSGTAHFFTVNCIANLDRELGGMGRDWYILVPKLVFL